MSGNAEGSAYEFFYVQCLDFVLMSNDAVSAVGTSSPHTSTQLGEIIETATDLPYQPDCPGRFASTAVAHSRYAERATSKLERLGTHSVGHQATSA